MSFILFQLLNELSQLFNLTYRLSPFFLIAFSILNSLQLVFCNSFSQNVPTFISPLRSLITYPWHGSFCFFDHKEISDQTAMQPFHKNIFIFWKSYTITNFEFRIFLIMFNLFHYVLIMTILNTHIQRVSLLLFYDMFCCMNSHYEAWSYKKKKKLKKDYRIQKICLERTYS